MRCAPPGFGFPYCGETWKLEVWMFFSAMPARFSVSNTPFIARELAASAAAAVPAWVTTPVKSSAWSGVAFTTPDPQTQNTHRDGADRTQTSVETKSAAIRSAADK